jgi:hypothetical protein
MVRPASGFGTMSALARLEGGRFKYLEWLWFSSFEGLEIKAQLRIEIVVLSC